jgi:hypothetical protein
MMNETTRRKISKKLRMLRLAEPKQVREERARKMGKARVASQTPEQRSESARHAVNARWARERTKKEAA